MATSTEVGEWPIGLLDPVAWLHFVFSVKKVTEIGMSGAEGMLCSWSCRISPSLIYGHAAESAYGIFFNGGIELDGVLKIRTE